MDDRAGVKKGGRRMIADIGEASEAHARIQQALETGGAQFISQNGGGPGVRLRKRQRSNTSS